MTDHNDCVAACVPDANEGDGDQNNIKLNIIRLSSAPFEVSVSIHTRVKALKESIWEIVDIAPHRQQLDGTRALQYQQCIC